MSLFAVGAVGAFAVASIFGGGDSSDDEDYQRQIEQMRQQLDAQYALSKQRELERQQREREFEQRELEHERAHQERDRQHHQQLHETEQMHIAEMKALQLRSAMELATKMKEQLRKRIELCMVDLCAKKAIFDTTSASLVSIRKQIAGELQNISHFALERNDDLMRIIVPIGRTGDGKSTFCNRVMGCTSRFADDGPFTTSGAADSCTKDLSKLCTTLNGLQISLVDTPGYGDTQGIAVDRQHLNNLCSFLRGSNGINAFVLVRNATNIRFDNGFQRMLARYHSMFGDVFFERLVVIATRVDFDNEQFERDNTAVEMKKSIIQTFGLEGDGTHWLLPVIPLGRNNYVGGLEMFTQNIPDTKFTCENIKSPIDDLRQEESRLVLQLQVDKSDVKRVQTAVNNLESKIRNL